MKMKSVNQATSLTHYYRQSHSFIHIIQRLKPWSNFSSLEVSLSGLAPDNHWLDIYTLSGDLSNAKIHTNKHLNLGFKLRFISWNSFKPFSNLGLEKYMLTSPLQCSVDIHGPQKLIPNVIMPQLFISNISKNDHLCTEISKSNTHISNKLTERFTLSRRWTHSLLKLPNVAPVISHHQDYIYGSYFDSFKTQMGRNPYDWD